MRSLQKILCVDDETDIRTVVKLTLERGGGYEVRVAESARQALEILEDGLPDMIILDVMMPEMDGPALLKTLRDDERYRDIPVVFMTAEARSSEIEGYREMGVLEVIPKPFDPFTLAADLRAIWMRYQKGSGVA